MAATLRSDWAQAFAVAGQEIELSVAESLETVEADWSRLVVLVLAADWCCCKVAAAKSAVAAAGTELVAPPDEPVGMPARRLAAVGKVKRMLMTLDAAEDMTGRRLAAVGTVRRMLMTLDTAEDMAPRLFDAPALLGPCSTVAIQAVCIQYAEEKFYLGWRGDCPDVALR